MILYVGSAVCIDESSTNSKESWKTLFRCRHPFCRHVLLGDESYPAFLCGKLMMLKESHHAHCLLYTLTPLSQEQDGQAGVTGLSLPENKQSTSPPSEPPSTCPNVHTALKIPLRGPQRLRTSFNRSWAAQPQEAQLLSMVPLAGLPETRAEPQHKAPCRNMADLGVQAPGKHGVAAEFFLVTPSHPAEEVIYWWEDESRD